MRERGATFLVLLLALAFVASVLASTAVIWSQAQQREREKQLLWAGDQFRQALLAYARAGNGTYPRKLEELLEDPRSPAKRRFLRRIYDDPMTRSTDWELMRNPLGGIIGVHSRSQAVPIKSGQFPEQYARFERARTYADWKFAAIQPKLEIPQEAQPKARRDPLAAQPPAESLPAPEERRALIPGEGADATTAEAAKVPAAEAAKAVKAEGNKPAPSATAPAPSGAPAQPAATSASAARTPDSSDSAQRTPGVFVPNPLTPLQSLQSPYTPGAFGAPPTARSPASPTSPGKSAPTETQPATQSR